MVECSFFVIEINFTLTKEIEGFDLYATPIIIDGRVGKNGAFFWSSILLKNFSISAQG